MEALEASLAQPSYTLQLESAIPISANINASANAL